MIAYDEALRAVLARTPLCREIDVSVLDACGLFTSRPLRARWPSPRFDQSAVDGYAVAVADLGGAERIPTGEFPVLGELPAGVRRVRRLRPRTVVRVYTGSPLPPGADAVVMQEDCERIGAAVRIGVGVRVGANIRRAGEECARGAVLLPAGTPITPPVVALYSTFGATTVRARARPRVEILVLGDEIFEPGRTPHRYGISDANGPALVTALRAMGLRDVRARHVRDDAAAIRRAMRTAIERADVVISVGGASVGDHDHAGAARRELGVVDSFDRVAMKPGKPTAFGVAPSGSLVFSLPGNPVAALVGLGLFVRPSLHAMMGSTEPVAPRLRVRLGAPVQHRPGRLEWVRARLGGVEAGVPCAFPLAAQGSHMLTGIAHAEVLLLVPAEATDLAAGTDVDAVPLRWS